MILLAIARSQVIVKPILGGVGKLKTKQHNKKNPKSPVVEEHENKNGTKWATKLRYAISSWAMTEQMSATELWWQKAYMIETLM